MKLYFEADFLRDYWFTGKKTRIKNKYYRVGKMSYGDYFLEPGQERGETKPFNRGTKWLYKIDNYDIYAISHTL